METIGSRIKRRREELGITQDELANLLGYKSRSSVHKIELGKRSIPPDKIKAIADALNTTPEFIMGWGANSQTDDDITRSEKGVPEIKTALELTEQEYGKVAARALGLYLRLDEGDRGEIRGIMRQMLKEGKYAKS